MDAYNNLGLVYLEQGKLELAQFIYQRALSAIPDAEGNALVHANLGRVYLAQGRVVDAEDKFKDALLKDNDLVVAMMFLGQLYTENRNWEGTVAVLERSGTRAGERSHPRQPRSGTGGWAGWRSRKPAT